MKKQAFILLIFVCFLKLVTTASEDSMALKLANYKAQDSLARWLTLQKKRSQYYRSQNQLDSSQAILTKSLAQLWRTPSNQEEKTQLSWIYVNRAYLFEIQGHFLSAQKDYLKAVKLFDELTTENYHVARFVWHPLANIYTRLGENELASQFMHKSIAIYAPLEAAEDLAGAYNDLAIIAINKYEFKKAVDFVEKGLKIHVKSPLNHSLLYSSKAKALHQLKAIKLGIAAADSSIQLFRKTKLFYNGNSYYQTLVDQFLVGAYTLSGQLYLSQGDLQQSEKFFQDALANKKVFGTEKHRKIAQVYLGLAQVKLEQQQSLAALQAYQQALNALFPNFNELTITANPDANILYAEITIGKALLGKAQAAIHEYKLSNEEVYLSLAHQCYKLYFDWEKKLRASHYYESSKLLFTAQLHRATEAALTFLSILQEKSPKQAIAKQAFQWIEQSKGVLLAESNTNLYQQIPSLAGDSILQELQVLKQQYHLYQQQQRLDSVNNQETELQALKEAIFQHEQIIQSRYPFYHQLKSQSNDTLSIQQLNKYLQNQQADLISYFLGNQKAYVVLVSKGKFHFLELDQNACNLQSDSFLQELSTATNNAIQFEEIAHTLFKTLIPFAPDLKQKKWIILPDGVLNQVPFEALVTKLNGANSFKQLHYLLLNKELSYSPSAKFLLQQKEKHRFETTFLGIAPSFTNSSLPALTNASNEVKIGYNYFGGKVLKAEQLEKNKLLQQLPQAQIIHWVSHAGVDSSYTNGAWISLGGIELEGRISTPEFLPLQLSTTLLTLNACETALGQYKAGEGIYSLGRSFASAGAQNIITNLWQANHQVNSTILENFYAHLQKSNRIAFSLTAAKRNYLNHESTDELGAHPRYWAAPILIGTNNKLVLDTNNYSLVIGGIVITLLLLLLAIRKLLSK